MREAITCRIKVVAWTTMFFAPVIVAQLYSELASRCERQAANYSAPLPALQAQLSTVATAER